VCLEGSADSFLSVEQHPEIWPRPSTTEQGHELIVRRFEQCPSEDVLADTIVKGKLPGTGGPSPLLVLGLAAVALGAVAGIVVLRRS
jgi:hypothetical protein